MHDLLIRNSNRIFMKFMIKSIAIALSASVIACSQIPPAESIAATTPAATKTIPATSINNDLVNLPTPIPDTVAFDFSEDFCSASWTNNGENLPCPGNSLDAKSGYINRFDEAVIYGDIPIPQPGLLTIPAQQESRFQSLFGKYPPFNVMEGDRFRAFLACANAHPGCDTDLALEYYDANGQYSQLPAAKWAIKADEKKDFLYADVDLSILAGQTIQFSLSVRDNGNPSDDVVVWILPHIARLGENATDATPSHQLDITQINAVSVSGIVDLKSAPPFLYDDHPPGSPAAVVFFEINSDKWYTVNTSPESAAFTIDIMPGEYFILAYAHGVGDVATISGAYTGINPSCGNPMAVLQVFPEQPISTIKINNWNWACGGDAKRLEKPDALTLP